MTNSQYPQPAQVAPVSLLEAIDYALNQAPCECPHSMRFERGEHMSGCYLFDLNVEYAKTAPAIPAPEGALTDEQIGRVVEKFQGGADWTDDDFDSAMRLARAAIAAERQALAAQAPAEGDGMLEPLVYAAMMHSGTPKTVAEFERAAANVADMLQRRAEVTHNKPVASIYISDDGSREFDDWRVDLPPGNHQLFTAPRPDQPQPESLPHPGAPEAEEMIEKLLAECNRPSNMKNAARAGYMAAKRLLQHARQPLPATDDAEPNVQPKGTAALTLAEQAKADDLDAIRALREQRAVMTAPTAPSPAPAPGADAAAWLPRDLAIRLAQEHPGPVTVGLVQSIAKAVQQLRSPAVGDCADLLEALVLMEDAQARIDSLPMFPTTYATEAARFKLFDARQAARAAIAARSHPPVQHKEGA